jgi:regulator of sigma E protease
VVQFSLKPARIAVLTLILTVGTITDGAHASFGYSSLAQDFAGQCVRSKAGSLSALYIIPILAILILVHEIGHFAAARMVGIRVKEFGLGLPPRLFGRERGGVIYSFNAIPLGGFVRVHGEDGSAKDEDSLHAKGKLERTFFYGAGSFMNFALAIVLVMVLIGVRGEPVSHVYVADVEPDSPAAEAGWEAGDRFLEVGNSTVDDMADVVTTTHDYAGETMPVTLFRAGEEVTTEVQPRENPPADQGRTGIQITASPRASLHVGDVEAGSAAADAGLQAEDQLLEINGREITDASIFSIMLFANEGEDVSLVLQRGNEQIETSLAVPVAVDENQPPEIGVMVQQDIDADSVPIWQIIPLGFVETWNILVAFYDGIMMLISGEAPLDGIAGPIGMGQLASEVLEVSPEPAWIALANLTILLSLNLGILNLLPLPALDGGRLLFVLIETLRGKPVSPEREGLVHLVGLVMLLGLMFFIAFMDIDRLISGDSILP